MPDWIGIVVIQRIFNWQDEELRDFTSTLGSLFSVTTEAGHEVIKPYHKSLADWLADEAKAGPYFVSMLEGHRMLAGFCSSSWKGNHYSLRHLPSHLMHAKLWVEFEHILTEFSFYHERFRVLGRAALV